MQDSSGEMKAKAYQKKKQALSLFHLIYSPAVLFLTVALPVSAIFKDWAYTAITQDYGALALYFGFFSFFLLVLDFPFSIYSGFILEHQYALSNQTFAAWFKEFLKKSLLSFVFSLLLIEALFALIWNFPDTWWLMAWAGFALVSYGVGKIFPVWIVPLFYKYSPLNQDALRRRILDLANRYKMPVENVYSLNLSKTTKKANAAFMGIGKTKRVVLSDTLLEHFTDDEIEVVVAHELGHFIHRDIIKSLVFGIVISFFSFWIAFRALDPLAGIFGFEGAGDIAALPILFLIFYAISLILMPLQNGFSRWRERAADRFALAAFPKRDAFMTCMEKLGRVNLADPDPNPLYEWFFYDHPAIRKRIRMAQMSA